MKTAILLFTIAMLLARALFAQDYAIRFVRPLKAGDELKISATAKQSQSMTVAVNGAVQKEDKQETSVQLDAVEKVIEADASGKDKKITLTVDKFTQTADGNTTDVAPKGTVITSSFDADNKPAYEIDGEPADPVIAQALKIVDLSSVGASDDDAYGAKERKKKGDSWDVNGDLARKAFEATGDGAQLDTVAGKSTVEDATGDTITISSHITGNLKPPLPATITVDQATLDATIKRTQPIDVSKYDTEDSIHKTISFTGHADSPNGKVVIKSIMDQSASRAITPVK